MPCGAFHVTVTPGASEGICRQGFWGWPCLPVKPPFYRLYFCQTPGQRSGLATTGLMPVMLAHTNNSLELPERSQG